MYVYLDEYHIKRLYYIYRKFTLNKIYIEIKKFKKLILSKIFVIIIQKNCLQIKNKDYYDRNNYCYKFILFVVLVVFLAKKRQ